MFSFGEGAQLSSAAVAACRDSKACRGVEDGAEQIACLVAPWLCQQAPSHGSFQGRHGSPTDTTPRHSPDERSPVHWCVHTLRMLRAADPHTAFRDHHADMFFILTTSY